MIGDRLDMKGEREAARSPWSLGHDRYPPVTFQLPAVEDEACLLRGVLAANVRTEAVARQVARAELVAQLDRPVSPPVIRQRARGVKEEYVALRVHLQIADH